MERQNDEKLEGLLGRVKLLKDVSVVEARNCNAHEEPLMESWLYVMIDHGWDWG